MKTQEETKERNVVNPSKASMDLVTEFWEAARYTGNADCLDKRGAAFLIDEFVSQALAQRDREIIEKIKDHADEVEWDQRALESLLSHLQETSEGK